MALYLNSTKIGSTAYNVHNSVSTKLNKMKMGNTDVWQGLPPYYNELKNGTVLTQSQWLEFLNGDGIATVIAKGDQASFRGKKVQVENGQTTSYKNWIIADFSHNYTGNNCDLIQANTVIKKEFSTNSYYNDYSRSTLRTWLNGTYYNSFSSDIKARMISFNRDSVGADTVKILTMYELGFTGYGNIGLQYPIFTDNSSRIRTGADTKYFSRTAGDYTTSVRGVNASGGTDALSCTGLFGIVPCICFS